MLELLGEQVQTVLGMGSDQVSALGTGLRTLLIYAATLALVRLGSKRFLSKASAFDIVVAIMLGSIMSRGSDGSTSIVPTIVAGAVLVGLHGLFAALAYHTDWFGDWVKGHHVLLIQDGQVQEDGLGKAAITPADLAQSLRMEARETDPAKIKLAYMERDGKISIVPYPREPKVINVSVEEGVQTVRIDLQ